MDEYVPNYFQYNCINTIRVFLDHVKLSREISANQLFIKTSNHLIKASSSLCNFTSETPGLHRFYVSFVKTNHAR